MRAWCQTKLKLSPFLLISVTLLYASFTERLLACGSAGASTPRDAVGAASQHGTFLTRDCTSALVLSRSGDRLNTFHRISCSASRGTTKPGGDAPGPVRAGGARPLSCGVAADVKASRDTAGGGHCWGARPSRAGLGQGAFRGHHESAAALDGAEADSVDRHGHRQAQATWRQPAPAPRPLPRPLESPARPGAEGREGAPRSAPRARGGSAPEMGRGGGGAAPDRAASRAANRWRPAALALGPALRGVSSGGRGRSPPGRGGLGIGGSGGGGGGARAPPRGRVRPGPRAAGAAPPPLPSPSPPAPQ